MTVQKQQLASWPVAEIFGPTIQGEGALIGQRTMFVRFAYCDGAGREGWCTWCDSMHAVDPRNKGDWKQMTKLDILDELQMLGVYCKNVTLTGGNPCIHELYELVTQLHFYGYDINVETQGTIFKEWLNDLRRGDYLTLSPKPPSAAGNGWDTHKFQEVLSRYWGSAEMALKIVIDPYNEADYIWAKHMFKTFGDGFDHKSVSLLTPPGPLSVVEQLGALRKLSQRICADEDWPDVRVLMQYHTLIWGKDLGR